MPPEFATTSSSDNWGWTDSIGASSSGYTPTTGDEGRYLRAGLSYDDSLSNDKAHGALSRLYSGGARTTPSISCRKGSRSPRSLQAVTVSRTVNENSEAGTRVGARVRASDPDGDVVAFSLDGADKGLVHHRPADRADPGRRRRRAGLRVGQEDVHAHGGSHRPGGRQVHAGRLDRSHRRQ